MCHPEKEVNKKQHQCPVLTEQHCPRNWLLLERRAFFPATAGIRQNCEGAKLTTVHCGVFLRLNVCLHSKEKNTMAYM